MLSMVLGSGYTAASRTDTLLLLGIYSLLGVATSPSELILLRQGSHAAESRNVKHGRQWIFTYLFTYVTITQIKIQNISIIPEDSSPFSSNNHPSCL